MATARTRFDDSHDWKELWNDNQMVYRQTARRGRNVAGS